MRAQDVLVMLEDCAEIAVVDSVTASRTSIGTFWQDWLSASLFCLHKRLWRHCILRGGNSRGYKVRR